MSNFHEEQLLAETYLDEMLEAESKDDYELWIKRFEANSSACPDKESFNKDVKEMGRILGAYKGREFLGFLNGAENGGNSEWKRFIWKGVFDNAEVLIDVRLHKKDGQWYVNRNSYSL